jgi:translocation and assembly module TamB
MSARARRALTTIAATLVLVVLLGAALVLWTLGSRTGARWAFERLGAALPGELRARDLRGSIRGPLRVRGLHYQADAYELTIEDLRLEWSLRRLVSQRLDIWSLRADSVTVRLKPPSEAALEERAKAFPDVDLPLDILIRQALVTDLALHQPGAKEPFTVDTLALAAVAIRDSFEVERLRVRSPSVDLELTGHIVTRGAYPLAIEGRWTLRTEETSVTGEGTLKGSLDTLLLAQHVREPFAAQVDGRLFQPLREPILDVVTEFRNLRLGAFDPKLHSGSLGGSIQIHGRPDDLTSEGRIASRAADWGPLEARYRVRRSGPRWTIERLDLLVPGGPTRLSATGTVVIAEDATQMNLNARWTDLTWPTTGPSTWRSRSGRALLSGTLERYQLVADADLLVPRTLTGKWHLEGSGDARAIDLRRIAVSVAGGNITGRGRVAWSPRVTWQGIASGSGLRTAEFLPPWPGTLGFDARSAGRMTADDHLAGNVVLERLAGEMRGRPVSASGEVRFAGEQYRLSDALASWGDARFAADGPIGRRWDLTWSFAVPNLAILAPDAGGKLSGIGHLTGPADAYRLKADIEGDSLVWQDFRIADLDLFADVDPAGDVKVDARVRDLLMGDLGIDSLGLEGRGPRMEQRWIGWAEGATDRLDLILSGSDHGPGWRGHLERLDLRSDVAGSWTLAAPAVVSATADEIALRQFCWTSQDARLCAEIERGPEGAWVADAELVDLPLALLTPLLPRKMAVHGPLDGTLRARVGADGMLEADVDLAPGPGEIRYLALGGDSARVRFERGSVTARSDPRALSAAVDLNLPQAGTAKGRFELSRFRLGREPQNQPVGGRIEIDLRDLSIAQAFLENVEDTRGALQADIALSGTLSAPLAAGELRLTNGRALLPEPGLELQAVEMRAVGEASGGMTFEGSARSGPGTIRIQGNADLMADSGAALRATVSGQRFLAVNTREAEVLVSPHLNVEVSGTRVDLTGQVDVPRAHIETGGWGEDIVPAAEDVVVVQRSGGDQPWGRNLHARVRFQLGDDVELRAHGLDAEPTGSILVLEDSGQPTRGTGELRVTRGTYRAYGQDLAIERGRLIFGGGPIENPGIDLRATRTASDGVVAGFEVHGRLQEPILSVFSEPPMGESQVLSYVMFGRPLQDVSSGEGALATRLATALEVPGGNLLLRQITPGLGLEEARIESEGGLREASLVLGKFLSPRLYVHYGIGLFEAASTIRLRYTLSRLWTLGAEVSDQNRADLQYTVEW